MLLSILRLVVVMVFVLPGGVHGQGQGQGQGQTRDQFRNALLAAVRSDDTLDESDVDDYVEFSAKYDRFGRYFNPGDLKQRFSLFRESKRKVAQWNREASARSVTNHGREFRETYGLTDFADLTPAEKQARFLDFASLPDAQDANSNTVDDGARRRLANTAGCTALAGNHFKAVDNTNSVRSADCGPAAKNQAGTNACWVFASTQMFECNYQMETGELKSFSEQQAVDCSRANVEGSKKRGGKPNKESAWIAQKGLCGAYNWAWDAAISGRDLDNYCYCNEQKKKGTCYDFAATNGDELTEGAQKHSLSFGMYVDDKFLALQGPNTVFEGCDFSNSPKYGHAMAIVGQWYGDYVRVKNSMGTNWGDNGYAWVAPSAIFGSCKYIGVRFAMNYGFSDAGTSFMPGLIERPGPDLPLPAVPVHGPDADAEYKPRYKPYTFDPRPGPDHPDPVPVAGPINNEPTMAILFSLADLLFGLAVGICLTSLVYSVMLCNKLNQTRDHGSYQFVKNSLTVPYRDHESEEV